MCIYVYAYTVYAYTRTPTSGAPTLWGALGSSGHALRTPWKALGTLCGPLGTLWGALGKLWGSSGKALGSFGNALGTISGTPRQGNKKGAAEKGHRINPYTSKKLSSQTPDRPPLAAILVIGNHIFESNLELSF